MPTTRKRVLLVAVSALLAVAAAAGCRDRGADALEAGPQARRYPLTGVVRSANVESGEITVAHEPIPGLMDAMTMTFTVKERWAARAATPGARITGTLVLDGARSWLEGVALTSSPAATSGGGPGVLDEGIGPSPGTPLPSDPLRDQAGREVTSASFAGRDVVLTFIYTRCPLPEFCPLMMTRLNEVASRLRKAGRRDDVHLVAISIDPAHDTPEVLADYGRRHITGEGGDPFRRWSLLTGTPAQVQAWARFFALAYEPDGDEIAHGLRTAVVDREGKVVGVLRGNDWTTDQLMDLLPPR